MEPENDKVARYQVPGERRQMEELLALLRRIGYEAEGVWCRAYYGIRGKHAEWKGERKAKKLLREGGYSEEEIKEILESEENKEEIEE